MCDFVFVMYISLITNSASELMPFCILQLCEIVSIVSEWCTPFALLLPTTVYVPFRFARCIKL
jgi:hypothetical protein